MIDPQLIVLVSGAVSSGKTTLGDMLVQRFEFSRIKTKEILQRYSQGSAQTRAALQALGTQLDDRTKGTWVRDEVTDLIAKTKPKYILVDAVRIELQVEAIRKAYGHRVYHIHLEAPSRVLATRYGSRSSGIKEFKNYNQVGKNSTEKRITNLANIADLVIDTDRCTKEDVLVRAASHLGLYGSEAAPLVDVLVGGEYGSEGKGHIASYLAREYDLLVRVGGPNAGHKVFRVPDPYTHHQLPSGTLFSNAKLLIGPGAVLNVLALLKEIADCGVRPDRLTIDPKAMIIQPEDITAERKVVKEIGSTGQGVGAAAARRIMGRAKKKITLAGDVPELKPFTASSSAYEQLESAYAGRKRILVEGTQGTGLSLYHGSYPFVTSRDTTVAGVISEVGIPPRRVRKVVMVCRSYPIRVQNPSGSTSGPMSQEITWAEVAKRSAISQDELERTERTSTTNRERRVGEFDWNLLRKASALNGPTDIALTFADYLGLKNANAHRFEQLTPETIRFTEEVERVAGAPVTLISTRFHWRSIIDRRAW